MQLRVTLTKIQHIASLQWSVDLDRRGITAIVGRNGCGKTTLAKALLTIPLGDTLASTSSEGIVGSDSWIRYEFGEQVFEFRFDTDLETLSSRKPIPRHLKAMVGVELPVPHGDRFKAFQAIVEHDHDLRTALAIGRGAPRQELNDFLNRVYRTERFTDLLEVRIRHRSFYCFRRPQERYLREDHLSSGEYFLISVYRRIVSGVKFLFIDEIDISLDADAQARLTGELRSLCERHGVHLVFTTHSLALMSTLELGEMLYMEREASEVTLRQASYNYVRTLMFGFKGWDKHILTEDEVLEDFLRYLIERYCTPTFYQYQVIHIGGAVQVASLLDRNSREHFFGPEKDVICVLDGDQAKQPHAGGRNILCIPLDSVEKALYAAFMAGAIPAAYYLNRRKFHPNGKELFNELLRIGVFTRRQVFEFLCSRHEKGLSSFAMQLSEFLGGKLS
jgi:predicted ATPase